MNKYLDEKQQLEIRQANATRKLTDAQTVHTYVNCGTDVANSVAKFLGLDVFSGLSKSVGNRLDIGGQKDIGNILNNSYDLTGAGASWNMTN